MMRSSPFGAATEPGWRQWLLLAVALGCAAALFAAVYVGPEHPAYVWDFGMYWHYYQRSGTLIATDPTQWLMLLVGTIVAKDYNLAPIVPLVPSSLLFGGSRTAYVASLCALFVVPAAMLASRLAQSRTPAEARLCLLACLTFPVFWNAALRGMPDVVGLIPLSLATLRLQQSAYLTTATPQKARMTGFLLWLPFLFRRWYAFSIVALVTVSLSACLILLFAEGRRQGRLPSRAAIMHALGMWSMAALGFLLPLFALQAPLVMKILDTSYNEVYSAYQAGPAQQLAVYFGWFGPVILLLAAAGAAIDTRRRAWNTIFCLAVAGLTALLFARVQSPSIHHPMPIALMLVPAYCSGVLGLWSALPQMIRLAVPALLAVNFANAYVPDVPGAGSGWRDVLLARRTPPLHLAQYAVYRQLIADLEKTDHDRRITVIASAPELSAALLAELAPDLVDRLVLASDVDLRDKFTWAVLAADYAVIADPTPLHLNPDGQRVVTLPAEEIRAGQGIGASYRLSSGGYRLDGGHVAAIYRRTGPIPPAEIYRLAERFHQFYPDWKESEPRAAMMLASSAVTHGEDGGSVHTEDLASIVLRPGATAATTLAFPTGAPFGATRLSVALRGDGGEACPAGEGLRVMLDTGTGGAPQQLLPGPGGEVILPVAPGTGRLSVMPGCAADRREAVASFGFAPW